MPISKETYIDFTKKQETKDYIINLNPDRPGKAVAFIQLDCLDGATNLDSALLYDSKSRGKNKIIVVRTNDRIITAIMRLHPEVFNSRL
jgi:hypothetical protein